MPESETRVGAGSQHEKTIEEEHKVRSKNFVFALDQMTLGEEL